jgi:D-alanyl-D-alanine carboxypeptidase (penicillin-binding protein 5/6)
MTAYLVFDALKSKKIALNQTFGVSEKAWKMPGSRMFIDPKMRVPVEDLIKGMIVQSGNDAVMALAEGVAGSKENFVLMMNNQATVLGMKSTTYKNPEGLTEAGHTTTANDLRILAQRIMEDFPQYVHYYAIKKYHYPGTPITNDTNRNLLLFRDPSVDGLKTGHTDAAGYCLIATGKRNVVGLGPKGTAGPRRLLSIVLGTTSENARANESQKLLNWGYSAFDAVKLFDANQSVSTPRVWKGVESTVEMGQYKPIVVAVPNGMASKIKTSITRADPIIAPVAQNQVIGTLKVTLADQPLNDLPLIALKPVPQSNIFGRAWDSMRLFIQ